MCSGYRANADELTRAERVLREVGASSKRDPFDVAWSDALITLSTQPDASHIDELIDRLRTITRTEATAEVRSDLGVAYMVRAELRHDAMGDFQALEQLQRAFETNSTSAVIAFNRALAMERLHLAEMAANAWRLVLRVDSTSKWSEEARGHLAALANSGASAPELNRRAEQAAGLASDPQRAREWVLGTAVGDWARRWLAGDEVGAREIADTAAAVGGSLAGRAGDSSVAHVADALLTRSKLLARAALVFDAAQANYRRGDFLSAGSKARVAIQRLRQAGGDALADWSELLLVGVDVTRADFAVTKRRSSTLLQHGIRHHDYAVAARALWLRALAEARDGEAAQAVNDYRAAATLYARIGERTNEGSMIAQQGDVLYLLGQDDVAFRLQLQGLALLGEHRSPANRAGPLLAIGRELGAIGLGYAERAVLHEAVLSGSKSERVQDLPEALLRLAAAEAASDTPESAAATLDRADTALQAVRDTLMRERMQMEVATVQASILAKSNPARAISRLDDVAAYFRNRDIKFDVVAPLVRAARLRLQMGDTVGAETNLAEAVSTTESQSLDSRDRSAARVIASVRRDVFNTLAAIHLARRDTVQAFIVSERARGHRTTQPPTLPAGELAVSYSTYEDRTTIWIVSRDHVRAVTIPATERELARLEGELEIQLRASAARADPSSPARRLYDLLVAPAALELGRVREVRIVADGLLARVPFAALERADGRYLIELLPIVYASAVRPTTNTSATGRKLLIVGNPAFDTELFPELPQLRAARREGNLVRAAHGEATLLEGAAATKTAFEAALRTAEVLHFAGHAVLVERAPLLSHLVLAKDAGGVPGNSLSAAEIGEMDLHKLRLVVLSACGTMQERNGRDDSDGGLAQAFLDAGASAVISSLWEVNDDATASVMQQLHARIATGDPPIEALRNAQLSQIAVTRRRRGTPWSAFRLVQE